VLCEEPANFFLRRGERQVTYVDPLSQFQPSSDHCRQTCPCSEGLLVLLRVKRGSGQCVASKSPEQNRRIQSN
jgi:hypothetical protein